MYNNAARQHFTYDLEGILQEQPEVTTTVKTQVIGQVDAADQILDVGTGRVTGMWILDVSAAQISGGDELYEFTVQGSTSPTFASVFVETCRRNIGHNSVLQGDQDLTVFRYVMPWTNVVGDTAYQYVRVRLLASAAATVSVTWGSWINKNPFP